MAYVIYTSGTTGQPKGVMITHSNVVNMATFQIAIFGGEESSRYCFYMNYVFDASVTEIFASLLGGSSLYVYDGEHEEIVDFISENNITHQCLPPAIVKQLENEIRQSRLKVLYGGGEPLLLTGSRFPFDFYLQYGPTEATVLASNHLYQFDNDVNKLGSAINNVDLYVLDASNNLVPIGTPGELFIGGEGVARGYLNLPKLTQERFVLNHLSKRDSEISSLNLYKTGDIVRRLKDGTLEYLGREDCQVKIRGYRIELGEIENVLSEHVELKQSVVIARENNGAKYLSAYLVPRKNLSEVDEETGRQLIESARKSMNERLPSYMIPTTFNLIDSLPLNCNGKLDHERLPAPTLVDINECIDPTTEIEKTLCQIWSEVLGLDKVGVEDNFFRIGGDSIICIQLVSRLRRQGFSIRAKDIFDSPTITQLIPVLESDKESSIKTEEGELVGRFGLLPIQKWFFDNQFKEQNHFNQSFTTKIPSEISDTRLESALRMLTEHHDMLTATYAKDDQWCQSYNPTKSISVSLSVLDMEEYNPNSISDILSEAHTTLDFVNGPLWKTVRIKNTSDGLDRLIFIFHHLIIDAVSWRIIVEDIQHIISGSPLSPKTSSYRQWVNTVEQYAQKNTRQVDYWRNVENDFYQYPECDVLSINKIELTEFETDRLLRDAPSGYHTEVNDLLLSAFSISLSQVFNNDRNVITLEGHGREVIDDNIDVTKTVGWFTTLYPVCLRASDDIEDVIVTTKEMLRSVIDKGIGFGALIDSGSLDINLPPISFNYLGQFDTGHSSECWVISDEDTGTWVSEANNDGLLINVNSYVQNGKLVIKIASRLSEHNTITLIKALKSSINRVVDAACAQSALGSMYTPSDLSLPDQQFRRLKDIQSRYNVEQIFPATSLQQGFVFHDLAYPQDDAYRGQVILNYGHALNVDLYKRAWEIAAYKWPVLRMAFDSDGEPLQIIVSGNPITNDHFIEYDFSHLPYSESKKKVLDIQKYDREEPFNLGIPGLIRVKVIKLSHNKYTVIRNEHHAVSDGWSGPIMWEFIHNTYIALCNGQDVPLESERTYLQAQSYYLKNKDITEEYWEGQKSNWNGATDIRFMLDNPVDLSTRRTVPTEGRITFDIDGEGFTRLKQKCHVLGITLNVAFQFAWHKLLQVYSNSEQTIVGTTVSGRDLPIEDIEDSVGLYINTLPLAVNWEEVSCADILKQIQGSISSLNSYCGVSLSSLQERGERLFQSLFVFENYPKSLDEIVQPLATLSDCVEKNDYPISLIVYDKIDSITVRFNYDSDLMSKGKAVCLTEQIGNVINLLAENPDRVHTEIDVLTDKQRHSILSIWNDTKVNFQSDKTLHQIFELQAARTPDSVALVFEGKKVTYSELNAKSNQLANYIRSEYQREFGCELETGTSIALYLDRSIEMLVSVLAVLKSGCAYVPISPDFPKNRTRFILEDTKSPILLTQRNYEKQLIKLLGDSQVSVISADNVIRDSELPEGNLPSFSSPTDLAYIIYTSGTTGKPKGVMIEHRSIVNRIEWMQTYYPIAEDDVVLQKTPYIFDVSVWELLWANQYGATTVISSPGDHKNPENLYSLMYKEKVTVCHFVPSMVDAFNGYLQDSGFSIPESIKYMFFSGEALGSHTVQNVPIQKGHGAKLINLYGPTEAAVDVTHFNCFNSKDSLTPPPLGKAVANTQLYILNEHMKPVPVGAPGELYIGGVQVARGYLNRPDLTRERFLRNPFVSQANKDLLYKTGDLVRWLSDGNIEYLGRNDFQVKINGHRIELGEIENTLITHHGVRQCCVYPEDISNSTQLVAWYVRESTSKSEDETIGIWESLYNESYRQSDGESEKFDITTWNSSYTLNPIPPKEMKEWQDNTITRIRDLNPKSILEIGCGTGLILHPLIDECDNYIATDLSYEVIEQLKKRVADLDSYKNASFINCRADEVGNFKSNSDLDTVILNSVCQYFPNIDYFKKVILSSVDLLGQSGTIFIGDVRDYALIEAFHLSVLKYQSNGSSKEELVEKARAAARRDKELLISPEYFSFLKKKCDRISRVQILPKRGQYHNEMNRFRYDVIIHVGNKCTSDENPFVLPEWKRQKWSKGMSLDLLLSSGFNNICLDGYPDKRVSYEFNLLLGDKLDLQSIKTVDELYDLAVLNGYFLSIHKSTESAVSDRLHLLFTKSKKTFDTAEISTSLRSESKLSNTPYVGTSQYETELRSFLQGILPDYIVPSLFVEVDEFPLTINGKLDRKSLPKPNLIESNNYVPPRNYIEEELCDIWASILGLESVGIDDNFFRIGGDSISAIKLGAQVKKRLNRELPLSLLYGNPRISDVSDCLKPIEVVNITRVESIEPDDDVEEFTF
ncbi:non-ribosomal peptide synthetase [uncultured Shewanella sp.]|uniref:non-ribosomal peptide synthetase n=1 Tax=uncultured Shewanella sp. TaxID=173975 RepID=UPI00260C1FE1|nr:non-ribosomal peptide synthetase [uncultured Shewanella sp.]